MVRSPERLLEPPEHVHNGQLELRVPEEAGRIVHARPFDRGPRVSCRDTPKSPQGKPRESGGLSEVDSHNSYTGVDDVEFFLVIKHGVFAKQKDTYCTVVQPMYITTAKSTAEGDTGGFGSPRQ